MLGIDIKRTSAIAICSILATSGTTAYAESLGKINISSNIECCKDFKGEIYVILSDKSGNQKLALLTLNNNYQCVLEVDYASYEVKDIHIYNTKNETDKNRKEMLSDFTITSSNLNLSDNNKISAIEIEVHSITDKEESKVKEETENKNEVEKNESLNKSNETDETKTDETENSNKLAKRKKLTLFNFILDAVIIISLGSIWFFKIRGRKEE